jgi:hypothetical protein
MVVLVSLASDPLLLYLKNNSVLLGCKRSIHSSQAYTKYVSMTNIVITYNFYQLISFFDQSRLFEKSFWIRTHCAI